MALEAENNGNIVENGGDNENIGGMNNNLTAVMDLQIAGVNTQLLVVTQFLQRCSGDCKAFLWFGNLTAAFVLTRRYEWFSFILYDFFQLIYNKDVFLI